VVLGDAQGLPYPRHPHLPKRHYAIHDSRPTIHDPRSTTHDPRLTLGIPELGVDFEPDSITAMDAGYDLLNGISFTKGCYVGQEITARMHYKNIARRGFYVLENEAGSKHLAMLKFEDVEAAAGRVTVENKTFTATLAGWMQPKLDLFKRAHENQ
jgi:folate-binding protein YgfZ